jgi:CheY-like chemotaxis protein/two-component sensor histidine kinase
VVASERLRGEDRRKDEFLAMLGHELRNPLSAIQNASELLTRSALQDQPTRKVGELLARQVTQLARLVDDLLDVSRISLGRIELQRETFELGDAVQHALEAVQPQIVAKQQRVTNHASPAPLYVEGDRARIVQAVSNVLANAAKYTQPGGRIRVTVLAEGESAVVEIADDGIGIPADLLPKVFDLFVQADRAADRAQGGLGIGLSVVRRLVEMHGGQVSAASEGSGSGSTFKIRLPLARAFESPSVDGLRTAPHPAGQRVLVVDDNADAADSLAALLQIAGHEAIAAYGAHEALERAGEFRAEVVLLDIGLPEMDGYEVARRLRERYRTLVLVALTGYGQEADVRRAKDAGFDAHITKPVSFEELQRVLSEF